MKYNLEIISSAEKEFFKIPKKDQKRILIKLKTLENNPLPHGYKKLIGTENQYRIRQGNYRIIYTIQSNILLIEIIKIKHRKKAYK